MDKEKQDNHTYIDDLIAALEKIKEVEGNIPVQTATLSHFWPPELSVRTSHDGRRWVLLNA